MTDSLTRLTAALADRYRIERELGQGGMATVYLAEDLKHHRKVALKVLRPELAAGVGPQRFLREIDLAAQLQHPNILPLHDSGTAGEFLYYVMPYVEGDSLADRLAREGELPVSEAVRILIEIADALAYAHARGVVHRDIKPANIMLSGRHALVTDFGVAKAVGDAVQGQTLTTAGIALGTPMYMAPEQAAADPHLDHRVDIYASGVMAYELLTGRPPFSGVTPQQLIAAHITEAPDSPTRYRPSIPPVLASIVMKCLAKRPADRWQSAAELLTQLESLPVTGSTAAQARADARSRLRWYGVAAAGILIVSVVAVLLVLRNNGSSGLVLGHRLQVTLDPGLEIDPAISPDGRFVAYAAGAIAETRLYVRQVEGGTPILLASELGNPQRFPSWSPDGKRIMFRSPRGIEVIPALGGVSRVVVVDTPATGAQRSRTSYGELMPGAWSPDGRQVAYIQADSLYIANLETDSVRVLAVAGEFHSMAWSPDGRWIACVKGNRQSREPGFYFGNLGQSAIWIVSVSDGSPQRLTQDGWSDASPAWLPGSRKLLFVSNRDGGRDIYQIDVSGGGTPSGLPVRLTTGLNAQTVSLSADGHRLAYSVFNETSNIWTLPVPSAPPVSVRSARPVTAGNQITESIDVSPDGKWVIFDSDRRGNADIYRIPIAGGEPEQLTNTPAGDFWGMCSPDGREIAFHSFQEGTRQLFTMTADGKRQVQVTFGKDDHRSPAWRPDGRALYYLYNFNGVGSEIRRIVRDDTGHWGAEQTVVRTDALPVVFSPNGQWMTFTSSRGLVLSDPDGGSVHVRVPFSRGGSEPQPIYVSWPSDSVIYYLAIDSLDQGSIWSVAPAGGPSRLLVRFDDPSRPWHRFGFDASGGQLYFTLGDRQSDIWVVEVASR